MGLYVACFVVDSVAVEAHGSAAAVSAVPANTQELGLCSLTLVAPALPTSTPASCTPGTRGLFSP